MAPRGGERFAHGGLVRGAETDGGRARASPAAGGRDEDVWRKRDEALLLGGGELHHAPPGLGISEGGEDLPPDAEVRVIHVGGLDGLGQRERQAAEVGDAQRVR